MYEGFFGLHAEPFSIAPDPRFLYMSDKHREALALLNVGLQRGASFVLLTGEIGAGKTTVWRRFLEQLPSNVDVASVVNPKLDVRALITRVFEDLGVPLPPDTVDFIDALHGHLLLSHAQGRRTLIVIDEAQALSADVLEQLRLLTNLDSSGKKLQVMLIAQPEMREILDRPELEPLAQRVVARYHLPALSEAETAGYISHRMTIAGYSGPLPFDGESLGMIHRLCRGVPRRINVLCDRALTIAQAMGTRRIGREIIDQAAVQVFGQRDGPNTASAPPAEPAGVGGKVLTWGMVAAVVALGGAWLGPKLIDDGPAAVPVAKAQQPAPAPPPPPPPAPAAPPPDPVPAPAPAGPTPAPAPPVAAVATVPPLPLEAFFPSAADEAQAWRALATLWGATLGGGDACDAAVREGLQCWRGRGGLSPVRQIDRPGLLRLVDERGRVAHALLLSLDGDQARLRLGSSERTLTLGELARWWRGEYATFWRAPPGWADGEPPAAWLAQQIARAAPAAGGTLRERVAAFQLTQGLVPDGVAGPLTLMQLNRVVGVPEPRLATSGSRPS